MTNNTIQTPRLGERAALPKTKRFGGLGLMLESGLGNVMIEESHDYTFLVENVHVDTGEHQG